MNLLYQDVIFEGVEIVNQPDGTQIVKTATRDISLEQSIAVASDKARVAARDYIAKVVHGVQGMVVSLDPSDWNLKPDGSFEIRVTGSITDDI